MKREGRQHGMVRTFRILPNPLNPRPETRFVTRFDTPATAGLFTRVSTKPTNHSKFTGKVDTMVKDNPKGNRKSKSNDVMLNPRLLTWRVAGTRPESNLSGYSATGILDQLVTDDHEYYDDNDDDDDDDDDEEEEYDQTRIDEDIKEDDSWYLV